MIQKKQQAHKQDTTNITDGSDNTGAADTTDNTDTNDTLDTTDDTDTADTTDDSNSEDLGSELNQEEIKQKREELKQAIEIAKELKNDDLYKNESDEVRNNYDEAILQAEEVYEKEDSNLMTYKMPSTF